MVNEPSVFEPLKFYCTVVIITRFMNSVVLSWKDGFNELGPVV